MNHFADDMAAPLIERIGQPADVPAALRALNIRAGRPVIVAVGGAGGMTPGHQAPLTEIMEQLLRTLEQWDGAIVDGGTDAGIMRLLGLARQSTAASVPLIGVAAEGTIALPGKPPPPDAARLNRHHTHAILVPGSAWGDESPWLSTVATAIADGWPSLTLVINGGQITYDDIDHSLRANRPVIIVAGTGRTADAIAAAVHGDAPNSRAAQIAASPDTRIVPLEDRQSLYTAIESILVPAS